MYLFCFTGKAENEGNTQFFNLLDTKEEKGKSD